MADFRKGWLMRLVEWVSLTSAKRMETAQLLYEVALNIFFYIFGLVIGSTIGGEIGKMLAGDTGLIAGAILGCVTWIVLRWKLTRQNRS